MPSRRYRDPPQGPTLRGSAELGLVSALPRPRFLRFHLVRPGTSGQWKSRLAPGRLAGLEWMPLIRGKVANILSAPERCSQR